MEHPPAAILERIVKAEGNLQLDYWEKFTFLMWLYLVYNPQMTAAALDDTVEKYLAANRLHAAVEGVFAGPVEVLRWLDGANAELGGSRHRSVRRSRSRTAPGAPHSVQLWNLRSRRRGAGPGAQTRIPEVAMSAEIGIVEPGDDVDPAQLAVRISCGESPIWSPSRKRCVFSTAQSSRSNGSNGRA
jgi:hypothetical protein